MNPRIGVSIMFLAVDPGLVNVGICKLDLEEDNKDDMILQLKNEKHLFNKYKKDELSMDKALIDYMNRHYRGVEFLITEVQMKAIFKRFVTVLVSWALMNQIQVKVVSPIAVKNHFKIPCRRNHALNKAEAVKKVNQLYPKLKCRDSNEADALLMALYGKFLIEKKKK